jgi:possible phosphinothricin acetyltransferase
MIRKIEEKDIPVILNWCNWYIRNSTATFETEELTLDEFKQRVAFITEKYPWIILEEGGKPVGYAYYSDFNSRQAYAC